VTRQINNIQVANSSPVGRHLAELSVTIASHRPTEAYFFAEETTLLNIASRTLLQVITKLEMSTAPPTVSRRNFEVRDESTVSGTQTFTRQVLLFSWETVYEHWIHVPITQPFKWRTVPLTKNCNIWCRERTALKTNHSLSSGDKKIPYAMWWMAVGVEYIYIYDEENLMLSL
jgi:hypothetical protein